MGFSIDFKVDPANKLLICEAYGEVHEVVRLEYMIKTIVKMAGKNEVKNIVLDVTQFKILCSNVEVAKLMIRIKQNNWISDLKIARIIQAELNINTVIAGIAKKLSLSIRNFESRSEAMLWLLFDKVREDS